MLGDLSAGDVLGLLLELDVLRVHLVAEFGDHVEWVGRTGFGLALVVGVATEPRHD